MDSLDQMQNAKLWDHPSLGGSADTTSQNSQTAAETESHYIIPHDPARLRHACCFAAGQSSQASDVSHQRPDLKSSRSLVFASYFALREELREVLPAPNFTASPGEARSICRPTQPGVASGFRVRTSGTR